MNINICNLCNYQLRSSYIIRLKENPLRFEQTFNQVIISKNLVEIQDCVKFTKCLFLLYFQTIIGTPHITCLFWCKWNFYVQSLLALQFVISSRWSSLNITKLTFICFCIQKLVCQLVWIRRTHLNWRHFLFESSFNITIRFYLKDRLKFDPKYKCSRKSLVKKTLWTRT